MEHNEPWQVYANNGIPIDGESASKQTFATHPELVMSSAHVWIWRRAEQGIEILLQKRAMTKKTWPGLWDISAAGHTDAGEVPLQTAVRETAEEIGITIDPAKLYFIFSLRTPLDTREIDHVYLYELEHDEPMHFDDGGVESVQWLSLKDFKAAVQDPDANAIVPQGTNYFSLLQENVTRISA